MLTLMSDVQISPVLQLGNQNAEAIQCPLRYRSVPRILTGNLAFGAYQSKFCSLLRTYLILKSLLLQSEFEDCHPYDPRSAVHLSDEGREAHLLNTLSPESDQGY